VKYEESVNVTAPTGTPVIKFEPVQSKTIQSKVALSGFLEKVIS
jgi:hypothetical protein